MKLYEDVYNIKGDEVTVTKECTNEIPLNIECLTNPELEDEFLKIDYKTTDFYKYFGFGSENTYTHLIIYFDRKEIFKVQYILMLDEEDREFEDDYIDFDVELTTDEQNALLLYCFRYMWDDDSEMTSQRNGFEHELNKIKNITI